MRGRSGAGAIGRRLLAELVIVSCQAGDAQLETKPDFPFPRTPGPSSLILRRSIPSKPFDGWMIDDVFVPFNYSVSAAYVATLASDSPLLLP